MMIANFHTALDARYAISDGVIYAAFIHPLSSLARRKRFTQCYSSSS